MVSDVWLTSFLGQSGWIHQNTILINNLLNRLVLVSRRLETGGVKYSLNIGMWSRNIDETIYTDD